jgi:hypothetical protein
MKTARKTPTSEAAPQPRLSASAGATRSLTVRLPVDLHEHLQSLVQAGAGDMTKALIAVVRMHRDGTQGSAELAKLATSFGGLNRQVAGLEGAVSHLRDEISLARGSQGRTLDQVAKTLGMLFELLRDGETMVDEPASSGTSSRQPAPSSPEFGGTADMPVARMPGTRPVPTPFGTENR